MSWSKVLASEAPFPCAASGFNCSTTVSPPRPTCEAPSESMGCSRPANSRRRGCDSPRQKFVRFRPSFRGVRSEFPPVSDPFSVPAVAAPVAFKPSPAVRGLKRYRCACRICASLPRSTSWASLIARCERPRREPHCQDGARHSNTINTVFIIFILEKWIFYGVCFSQASIRGLLGDR